MACIHATCVAIDGRGVLLIAASGAGKSDLALRLIDRGAVLVSDDYTQVTLSDDGTPVASAPASIAGQIEVRGIGIVRMPYVSAIPVRLAVDLDRTPERMPDAPLSLAVAGASITLAYLSPFEASAPIKVEWMLKHSLAAHDGDMGR